MDSTAWWWRLRICCLLWLYTFEKWLSMYCVYFFICNNRRIKASILSMRNPLKQIFSNVLRNVNAVLNCCTGAKKISRTELDYVEIKLERSEIFLLYILPPWQACISLPCLVGNMRTILWIIKFSIVVHLCVEVSFCWWTDFVLFSIWSIKLIDI